MSSQSRNAVLFTVSDMYCTCCGGKGLPIPRKSSRQREAGHLKKLYCLTCKEETNHVEVRPFDYTYEQLIQDIKDGKFKNKKEEKKNGKKKIRL